MVVVRGAGLPFQGVSYMHVIAETAEEMLLNYRKLLCTRARASRVLVEVVVAYPEAAPGIHALHALDATAELMRALAVIDLALAALAKPPEPVRDEHRL